MAVTWKKLAFEDDVVLTADTDVSSAGWVIDEDDMVSDLDTKVPTQQSVKAYVDAMPGTNLHYVPLSMSANYTIPTNQAYVGGDEFEMTGEYALTIEGTGRLVLVG